MTSGTSHRHAPTLAHQAAMRAEDQRPRFGVVCFEAFDEKESPETTTLSNDQLIESRNKRDERVAHPGDSNPPHRARPSAAPIARALILIQESV